MDLNDKSKLKVLLLNELMQKGKQLLEALEVAKESRDSDSKSSVGDKYETNRAMAQIEIEKLSVQLQKHNKLEKELNNLDDRTLSKTIEFGSLVSTQLGYYFFSIPFGKIKQEGLEVYAISLASPIGKALKGMKEGDQVSFQGKSVKILEIV